MQLRFDTVMSRLRATERKSPDINMGRVCAQLYTGKAVSFTDKDSNQKFTNRNYQPVPFRDSPSYELRADVLAEPAKAGLQPVVCEVSETVRPRVRTHERKPAAAGRMLTHQLCLCPRFPVRFRDRMPEKIPHRM